MGKVGRGLAREGKSAAGHGGAGRQWRGGAGWEARRRGLGGTEAAAVRRGVKQRGRKGTGPRTSIWLCRALTGGASQPRPDRWRGKACHVSDQRGGTLPRTHPCRAAMHGAAELFRRVLEIGAAKNVSFQKKTVSDLKIV